VVAATIDPLKMAPSFFRTATDQPFADGSGWLFADVVGSPNCSSNLFAAFIQLWAIAVRHFRSSSQAVSAICNAFRACSRNIFAFFIPRSPFWRSPNTATGRSGAWFLDQVWLHVDADRPSASFSVRGATYIEGGTHVCLGL
jgi:hypothetical protein